MAKACLRPLRMIRERPNVRKLPEQDFNQETALLDDLVTELIGPDFDHKKVDICTSKLMEMGCPRSDIASWILTCCAFNAALGPDVAGKGWEACRKKWITACKEFGIPARSIQQAEEFGKNFRGQVYRKPKSEQEAAMKAIYTYFFTSPDDIFLEIEGISEEEG